MAPSPAANSGDDAMGRHREISLGDQVTGADLDTPQPAPQQSLGDGQTIGDVGLPLPGVDELEAENDDGVEVVDLQARYEIQERLGSGGMGEVVKAIDRRLDRIVAIKRLRGELGDSRKAADRFLAEAKSIAALNQFNIVQIHDYGHAADGPFIVMEYVAGGTLSTALSSGPMTLDRAVEVGSRLCDALAVAHRRGIVHRDVKPDNVLMTPDGVPKLTDFGLARQERVDGGQTQAGAVLGTLDFMPPEQRADATQADARSDLWSLAATLYQAVTGEIPRVIVMDQVPERLRGVLGTALKVAPDDRFQSAEELRDALWASVAEDISEAGDLGEGTCPACETRNDTSRKFCRNCATSLETACLSCEALIAIWEDVCGSCGGRQSEVIARRRAEMESRKEKAESHREGFRFADAVRIAEVLRDEPDDRLHTLKEWADWFIEDVQREETQQRERLQGLVEEAVAHDEASDYLAGIHALEQVPEPLRKESVQLRGGSIKSADGLLLRLRGRQTTSQDLDREVRDRVKRRDLDGLIPDVDRLLKLRPNRRDLPKLKKQLQQFEDRQQEKARQQCREQVLRAEQSGDTDAIAVLLDTYLERNPDDEEMSEFCVEVGIRLEEERTRREQQQLQEVTQQRFERQERVLLKMKFGLKTVAKIGLVVVLLIGIGLSWKVWEEYQRESAEEEARSVAAAKRNSEIVARREAEEAAAEREAERKAAEEEQRREEAVEEARMKAVELAAREFALDKAASRLRPIESQSVDEGEELLVKAELVDGTRFGESYVYELAGSPPTGCRVDGRTGHLTWTPGETDGGKEFPITVRVKFAVSPDLPSHRSELGDEQEFVVTVKEQNRPPVVRKVVGQQLDLGKTLRLQLSANDLDVPANSLRFSLDTRDSPKGASIDAVTGELEWTPTATVRAGLHKFSVLVEDDGVPPKQVSVPIQVTLFKRVLGRATLAHSIKGHTGGITATCFSPNGKWAISGSGYHTLKIWDAGTGVEKLTLQGHSDDITSVHVSPDGKRIVSGSRDRTVKVWDLATGREMLSLTGHEDVVASVCFSPDGNRILSGSWDKTLKVWDAKTGQLARSITGHMKAVVSTCFSRDGKWIASGGVDKTVRVWDAVTGKQTISLEEPATVYSVDFSSDGKRLLSASRGMAGQVMVGGVTLWDLDTETEVHSKAHPGGTSSARFSGDGKWIVLGHHDSSVEVWDAATGETTLTLRGHSKRIRSVSFSNDGKRIISGGDDSLVKVWDVQEIRSSGSVPHDAQPKSDSPDEEPRS